MARFKIRASATQAPEAPTALFEPFVALGDASGDDPLLERGLPGRLFVRPTSGILGHPQFSGWCRGGSERFRGSGRRHGHKATQRQTGIREPYRARVPGPDPPLRRWRPGVRHLLQHGHLDHELTGVDELRQRLLLA